MERIEIRKGGKEYENDRFPRFGTNSLKEEEEEEKGRSGEGT